jgi:tubulin-specific chaperone B
MQLELYNGAKFLAKLDNDVQLLGAYPVDDGYRIHVLDNFVFDQNVEKFELTENQYESREDSLRNFLKKNRLGKYNEEEMQKIEEKRKAAEEEQAKKVAEITVGARCKVQVKNNPSRIGTVMYNGELEGKKGVFIGVKFDEPLGVNDGSAAGKRYFDCEPKYGSFVVPSAVEVGDFPPEDFNLSDEDEI